MRRAALAGALLALGAVVASAAEALRVVGPGGKPPARAALSTVRHLPDGRGFVDPAAPPLAVADDRGAFARLPADRPFVVVAEGLAAELVTGEAPAEMTLARAEPLAGVIRFDRGGPAKDLVLFAFPEEAGGLGQKTTTDAKGAYRFAHLSAGRWEVAFLRKDGRLQTLGMFTAGAPPAETKLVRGVTIEGKVVDAAQGSSKPMGRSLPFRIVRLPGGGEPTKGTTHEDGTFAVEGLVPGIYEARPDDATWVFDGDVPRLELPPTDVLRLAPWFGVATRAVRGRVVDAKGVAVAGVELALLADPTRPAPPDVPGGVAPATTGPDGAYGFEHVPPAEGWRVVASRAGFSPTVSEPFDVRRGFDAELPAIRLAPGWSVEVRVRAEGKPFSSARVEAVPTLHPAPEPGSPWEGFVRRATADADGRAVLVDLAEGDARVTVSAPGFLDATTIVAYPRTGNARTWIATLYPLPALEGRAKRSDGGPPPALRVVARTLDGLDRQEVRTDGNGAFRFPHLRPVATDLEAFATGAGAPTTPVAGLSSVVPGEAGEVELLLPPLVRLAGTVSGVRKAGPPPQVVLEAPRHDPDLDRDRWMAVATTTLDLSRDPGRFAFDGLAPGTYAVRAVQGARDSEALTLRLEAGPGEEVELEIPEGSRVAGVVLDGRDRPVLGASVRLARLRGDGDAADFPGSSPVAATDADGAYSFEDLAPGLWRITASLDVQAPDSDTIRVSEGEWLVVRDLVLGRGGTLVGRVVDSSGRGLHGAQVKVRALEQPPEVRVLGTAADGSFRADGLRAGVYLVRLDGWSQALARVEAIAEIVVGETTTVVLAAEGSARIEGTVTRRGKPVGGAMVELLHDPDEADESPRRFRTETDVGGRFAWDALPAGRYDVGLVDAAARSERSVEVGDNDRIVLDLEAWDGRLVGRVVTLAGDPVNAATVTARPGKGAEGGEAVDAEGRTDPDGRFVLAGVPVGRYDLRVEAPGMPPAVHQGAEADTQGSEKPVEIVIGRGATVDLQVLDDGRRGVRAARVWVEAADGTPLHARGWSTGPAGRLRISGIPPGGARIAVEARGYGKPAPVAVSLADGERSPITIVLRPAGTLRVSIVGSDRGPVPRARIDVLRAGTEEVVASRRPIVRADAWAAFFHVPRTGIADFEDLEEGSYDVSVSAGPRFGVVRVPVRVRARALTETRVVLGPP